VAGPAKVFEKRQDVSSASFRRTRPEPAAAWQSQLHSMLKMCGSDFPSQLSGSKSACTSIFVSPAFCVTRRVPTERRVKSRWQSREAYNFSSVRCTERLRGQCHKSGHQVLQQNGAPGCKPRHFRHARSFFRYCSNCGSTPASKLLDENSSKAHRPPKNCTRRILAIFLLRCCTRPRGSSMPLALIEESQKMGHRAQN